jgi:rRNA pseudouridine-1189 N-methylase Emg1 (Nep1/Mra1 family)
MILIKDNLIRIFVFARKDILIQVPRIVKVNTNYFKKNLFFHKNQNKTYYKNKI